MSADAPQEVLCPNPSCGKKYRLKGSIPAVFTCTKCGQAMDLSAFATEPAAPAAPATRSSRAAGAPSSRRSRTAREPEPEEDERRPRFEPKPKSNAALIWGSLGGLVLAVVLMIVLMSGKKDPEPAPGAGGEAASGTPAGVPGPEVGVVPSVPVPGTTVPGTVVPVVPGVVAPSAPTGTTPAAATPGATSPAEPPRRGGALSALQVWQPPADVALTAAEKEQVERALDTALNDTGRAVQEAQATLVSLDRKAIWRVVSEFKHIQDSDTFESRKGMIRAMVVDRILRMIDGYMERKGGTRDRINPESSPDWAMGVAKRWNTWLDKGYWKTKLAPWDPRVDEADEGAEKPAPRGR